MCVKLFLEQYIKTIKRDYSQSSTRFKAQIFQVSQPHHYRLVCSLNHSQACQLCHNWGFPYFQDLLTVPYYQIFSSNPLEFQLIFFQYFLHHPSINQIRHYSQSKLFLYWRLTSLTLERQSDLLLVIDYFQRVLLLFSSFKQQEVPWLHPVFLVLSLIYLLLTYLSL